MSSTEEQLVSFLGYTFFIYPVLDYLTKQPPRVRGEPVDEAKELKSKYKGAAMAIVFLIAISLLHIGYENMEKGPNHYNILGVDRGSSNSLIKKTYRVLSRELHPDKNKAPGAVDQFRKVTKAYNVLLDPEMRKIYDRLGDAGVKTSEQSVVDHKHIIIQMLVGYASQLILAFLMTFGEPTWNCFKTTFFGILFMLFVETWLVLEEVDIPVWILPCHTTADVVRTMHRMFPAFMNGSRNIVNIFSSDQKTRAVEQLEDAAMSVRSLGNALTNLVNITLQVHRVDPAAHADKDACDPEKEAKLASRISSEGVMSAKMGLVRRAVESNSDLPGQTASINKVTETAALLVDADKLRQSISDPGPDKWVWGRNLAIFLVVRFVFRGNFPTTED